jgi:hypothetical protein
MRRVKSFYGQITPETRRSWLWFSIFEALETALPMLQAVFGALAFTAILFTFLIGGLAMKDFAVLISIAVLSLIAGIAGFIKRNRRS